MLKAYLDYIQKGDGFGSEIHHNYDLRNKTLDWDTKLYVGEINNDLLGQITGTYIFSDLIKFGYNYNYSIQNKAQHEAIFYFNW